MDFQREQILNKALEDSSIKALVEENKISADILKRDFLNIYSLQHKFYSISIEIPRIFSNFTKINLLQKEQNNAKIIFGIKFTLI